MPFKQRQDELSLEDDCILWGAAPIQPWEFPKLWSCVHIDYAGLFQGHVFFVVVDAFSKWMNMRIVKQANSTQTISVLHSIFSTHGVPKLLVLDNGTAFTRIPELPEADGMRHNTSAPYHPATNGLAERAVHTLKAFLKKATEGSLEDKLSTFLFQYHITPHSTIGSSPAQLLMGRQLRSRLDLLRPDLQSKVQEQQQRQHSSTPSTYLPPVHWN